jgi:pimeloyl-ACP methyl ester carboxylesterase
VKIGYLTGSQGIDPKRPTVVFIHGAGGSAWSWLGLLSAVGRKVNTLALDLPGHGDTPGQAFDSIEGYADWLGRALEELKGEPGIGDRIILAGHSMGGAISQVFDLLHPDASAGLVLIGTGCELPVNPQLLEGLLNNFEQTVALVNKWCFAKDDKALKEESLKLLMMAGPETLYADFTACSRFSTAERVGRIEKPVLIIVGEEDKMTPPAMSEFAQAKIQGAALEVLPQAGHMVMVEKPHPVIDLITAFAGKVFG